MYKANLTWTTLERGLHILTTSNCVVAQDDNVSDIHLYRITPKGQEVLRLFRDIIERLALPRIDLMMGSIVTNKPRLSGATRPLQGYIQKLKVGLFDEV